MEKADRLFLRSNCIECGKVRAAVNFDAVVDDTFRGKEDQELRVFTGLSTDSVDELLEKFGAAGKKVPLIISHDGAIIEHAKNVIMHLRRNGMVNP